jgi:Flp pilus assembly protein TadD
MKRIAFAAIFLLLFAAGLTSWHFGRPIYRQLQERRALTQAKHFLTTGDYRNANLSIRRALALNPSNLKACELMAQLTELARAPQVLDWRCRVVELAPSVDNKLKLAAAALAIEPPPYPLASQVLEELAAFSTNNSAYHMLAAERELKLNHLSQAENHFAAASRLEPTNQLPLLNVAVLRLRSTNATTAATARIELEQLSSNPNLGHIALQWLANDCLIRKDFNCAEQLSSRLLADPRAGLEDNLQHLTVLHAGGRPGFADYLFSLQSRVSTNPAAIYFMASWMLAHDLAADARQWLIHCPTNIQSEQPVPMALANCYAALRDWTGLETWLIGQSWGEMEFVRLATLSRAEEQQNKRTTADGHWRLAVRQAGDRLGPLNYLQAMADAWMRAPEREDLLWRIFERYPTEQWAARELGRLYGLAGNTRGLNKLYGAIADREPRDFVAKNNFAATAMLLRTSLPKAHETAKEIYLAHPSEPIVVSTYAWSLQLQGQTREGLATLEKLKPEALQDPPVALYYGLLLCADKQPGKASQYFAQVDRATLLPEEKELLAAAQQN